MIHLILKTLSNKMNCVPYYGYGYGAIGLGSQEVIINPANVAQNVVIQQVPQQQQPQQQQQQQIYALYANIAMAQTIVNNALTISSFLPATTQGQSVANLIYQLMLSPVIGASQVNQSIGAFQAGASGSYLAQLELSLGYNLSNNSNSTYGLTDIPGATLTDQEGYEITPSGTSPYQVSFNTSLLSLITSGSITITLTSSSSNSTTSTYTASGGFTVITNTPVNYTISNISNNIDVSLGTLSSNITSLSSISLTQASSTAASTQMTIIDGNGNQLFSGSGYYVSGIKTSATTGTLTAIYPSEVNASAYNSGKAPTTANINSKSAKVALATVNVVFLVTSATSLTAVNSTNTQFYYFPLSFVFSSPDQPYLNTSSTTIIPQDTKVLSTTIGLTSGQYLFIGLQIPNTMTTSRPLQIMQPTNILLIPLPGVAATSAAI